MYIWLRSEVKPLDLYDDATILMLWCSAKWDDAALVIVQSERRGKIDDETLDTRIIPITERVFKEITQDSRSCTRLEDPTCNCAWHVNYAIDKIIQREAFLRRKEGEPYIVERAEDDESQYYHYGRSTY